MTAGRPAAVTVVEAARMLSLPRSTAYRLVADGSWPAVKVGRRLLIPTRWLDELVDAALEGREPRRPGRHLAPVPEVAEG